MKTLRVFLSTTLFLISYSALAAENDFCDGAYFRAAWYGYEHANELAQPSNDAYRAQSHKARNPFNYGAFFLNPKGLDVSNALSSVDSLTYGQWNLRVQKVFAFRYSDDAFALPVVKRFFNLVDVVISFDDFKKELKELAKTDLLCPNGPGRRLSPTGVAYLHDLGFESEYDLWTKAYRGEVAMELDEAFFSNPDNFEDSIGPTVLPRAKVLPTIEKYLLAKGYPHTRPSR